MQSFTKKNAVVVAVSVDSPQKNARLKKRLKLSFPLLSDADRSLMKALGVYDSGQDLAKAAIVVIDADRTIRWKSVSENFRKRPPVSAILGKL